jgi:hypothetical protein
MRSSTSSATPPGRFAATLPSRGRGTARFSIATLRFRPGYFQRWEDGRAQKAPHEFVRKNRHSHARPSGVCRPVGRSHAVSMLPRGSHTDVSWSYARLLRKPAAQAFAPAAGTPARRTPSAAWVPNPRREVTAALPDTRCAPDPARTVRPLCGRERRCGIKWDGKILQESYKLLIRNGYFFGRAGMRVGFVHIRDRFRIVAVLGWWWSSPSQPCTPQSPPRGPPAPPRPT